MLIFSESVVASDIAKVLDKYMPYAKYESIIKRINRFWNNKLLKAKTKKHKYHSTYYKDILITEHRYKTNIVISDSIDTSTPWIIVTNGDVKRAIKDYSYRFGAIECIFKNQKSNGFNLEKISNSSLESFTTMYTICSLCTTYLTILGSDFSKNTKCYKNVNITTHKTYIINGKRIVSLFNAGLTLFKLAVNNTQYIRLPFTMKLYDS